MEDELNQNDEAEHKPHQTDEANNIELNDKMEGIHDQGVETAQDENDIPPANDPGSTSCYG